MIMNLFSGFYVLSYNIRLKILMPENKDTCVTAATESGKIPPPLFPNQIFFYFIWILEILAKYRVTCILSVNILMA